MINGKAHYRYKEGEPGSATERTFYEKYHSCLGLPVVMSLISSFTRQAIPAGSVYVGDLQRAVRRPPDGLLQMLAEAVQAGEVQPPIRVYCSADTTLGDAAGITIVPCAMLEDVIHATWPNLDGEGASRA